MQCNASYLLPCQNGNCINMSLFCDRLDHCGDGSDESFAHAYCYSGFKITGTIIAGIVIGVVVGIAILCCLVGTIVDCFVHIYKYWCSCLHKAYHYQTEMTTFNTSRSLHNSPSEPTNLVVRALPPSYSAVLITCESPGNSRVAENTTYDVSQEFRKALNNNNSTATRLCSPPQGMPPSYSSIFLRGFGVDMRVSRNNFTEGQALLGGECSDGESAPGTSDTVVVAPGSRHSQRLDYIST